MEERQNKKFRFRLTIGNKIIGSFVILIALFIVVVSIIFGNGNSIDNVVKGSRDIYRPSKDAVNEFILIVTKSRMLVTNWVYLQTNSEDKSALRQLQDTDYPALRKRIQNLSKNWDEDQRLRMDTVFNDFDSLITIQRESIMANLQSFENYEDPTIKFMAENSIESEVIPLTNALIGKLSIIAKKQSDITEQSDTEVIASITTLKTLTVILGGVFLAIALISAIYLVISVTKPVAFLKAIVVKLGRGELVEEKRAKFNNDEIGDMAVAMDSLVSGLKATTLFAENIGNGNYNTDFKPLSEHDVLGNALINMRDNLAKVAEDDKKRNWATEGLAKFGEILRTNNSDLMKLADEIISSLVKYLKANQGALYIMDDSGDAEEATMSMKACYAWDKKKFLNHKIYRGEGLAGQAWQEGDIIYLTDVPQSYIKITSGLGDANPTSVLIVPLKVNDQIYGVVEIASFNLFQDHEMEFVQKIAESIASTISSVKINAKTQKLLEESQEMTEQMRAQEEEMRQNMEELQATQEEMQRSQGETESTMLAIDGALAVADYATDGTLTKANSNFLDIYGYAQDEVVGEHHRILVTKEEKNNEEYRQFWRDLASGYPKKGTFRRINRKGEIIQVHSSFSPVKNRGGDVIKIMEITYEIKTSKVLNDLQTV
ncbi:GAF domain-containing protein [Chryseosolibacter indicus]|uniref:GAF domain-containing protein n=1 Tax=Chryseosolibacter indicus TaxID=2782351 RepID=A0ABS5VJZ1_9BACT|nr:GAF domain-containing protein [Chryseosolibacter indicus]MBT1701747.1 GAF domain-containing protein [Chryseosolibacter indicus]